MDWYTSKYTVRPCKEEIDRIGIGIGVSPGVGVGVGVGVEDDKR